MDYLTKVLGKVASVVDAAVPVAVGSRTKIAVVACPVLGFLAPAIAVLPGLQPVAAALPIVQAVLCSATPFLALAGLFREK